MTMRDLQGITSRDNRKFWGLFFLSQTHCVGGGKRRGTFQTVEFVRGSLFWFYILFKLKFLQDIPLKAIQKHIFLTSYSQC